MNTPAKTMTTAWTTWKSLALTASTTSKPVPGQAKTLSARVFAQRSHMLTSTGLSPSSASLSSDPRLHIRFLTPHQHGSTGQTNPTTPHTQPLPPRCFHLLDCHHLWLAFPCHLVSKWFGNSHVRGPTTPQRKTLAPRLMILSILHTGHHQVFQHSCVRTRMSFASSAYY
jgi:hypothetical protein